MDLVAQAVAAVRGMLALARGSAGNRTEAPAPTGTGHSSGLQSRTEATMAESAAAARRARRMRRVQETGGNRLQAITSVGERQLRQREPDLQQLSAPQMRHRLVDVTTVCSPCVQVQLRRARPARRWKAAIPQQHQNLSCQPRRPARGRESSRLQCELASAPTRTPRTRPSRAPSPRRQVLPRRSRPRNSPRRLTRPWYLPPRPPALAPQ